VYRDPLTATARRSGWRYRDVTVLHAGASIAPLAHPNASVEVAALLPPPGYYVR
jgi:hypothetical protein